MLVRREIIVNVFERDVTRKPCIIDRTRRYVASIEIRERTTVAANRRAADVTSCGHIASNRLIGSKMIIDVVKRYIT